MSEPIKPWRDCFHIYRYLSIYIYSLHQQEIRWRNLGSKSADATANINTDVWQWSFATKGEPLCKDKHTNTQWYTHAHNFSNSHTDTHSSTNKYVTTHTHTSTSIHARPHFVRGMNASKLEHACMHIYIYTRETFQSWRQVQLLCLKK